MGAPQGIRSLRPATLRLFGPVAGPLSGDPGVKALASTLPKHFSRLGYTRPVVITKENVDKYLRPNAVF